MGHDHSVVALLQPRLHLGLVLKNVQPHPATSTGSVVLLQLMHNGLADNGASSCSVSSFVPQLSAVDS